MRLIDFRITLGAFSLALVVVAGTSCDGSSVATNDSDSGVVNAGRVSPDAPPKQSAPEVSDEAHPDSSRGGSDGVGVQPSGGGGSGIAPESSNTATRGGAPPLDDTSNLSPTDAGRSSGGNGATTDAGERAAPEPDAGDDASATDGGLDLGSAETGDSGTEPDAGEPYGRCDVAEPQCPWPDSQCNGTCVPGGCATDLPGGATGTGDDCPLPLTGNADPECNFGNCTLSCVGGLVCPDGMECSGSYCNWPDL